MRIKCTAQLRVPLTKFKGIFVAVHRFTFYPCICLVTMIEKPFLERISINISSLVPFFLKVGHYGASLPQSRTMNCRTYWNDESTNEVRRVMYSIFSDISQWLFDSYSGYISYYFFSKKNILASRLRILNFNRIRTCSKERQLILAKNRSK